MYEYHDIEILMHDYIQYLTTVKHNDGLKKNKHPIKYQGMVKKIKQKVFLIPITCKYLIDIEYSEYLKVSVSVIS